MSGAARNVGSAAGRTRGISTLTKSAGAASGAAAAAAAGRRRLPEGVDLALGDVAVSRRFFRHASGSSLLIQRLRGRRFPANLGRVAAIGAARAGPARGAGGGPSFRARLTEATREARKRVRRRRMGELGARLATVAGAPGLPGTANHSATAVAAAVSGMNQASHRRDKRDGAPSAALPSSGSAGVSGEALTARAVRHVQLHGFERSCRPGRPPSRPPASRRPDTRPSRRRAAVFRAIAEAAARPFRSRSRGLSTVLSLNQNESTAVFLRGECRGALILEHQVADPADRRPR